MTDDDCPVVFRARRGPNALRHGHLVTVLAVL